MNILVTGGAGYIGSVVVEQLVKQHNVVIYDNLSTGNTKLINPEAKFIKGDILDLKKLTKTLKKYKIELVVHLAAKTVVSESTYIPLEYYQTNTIGTFNVLAAMKEANCKNIIFSSSAAVYGNVSKMPILEDTTKNPCNPYGTSKLYAEELIKSAKKEHNFNYAIYRFFNVAGASESLRYGMIRDKLTLLIPCINQSLLQNKKFTIFGNKYKTKDHTALRDYVHVLDLAKAIIQGIDLLNQNKSCIVNLGSGKGYTVKNVYDTSIKILKMKSNFVYKPNRPGDPDALITSNKLALKILNWKPSYKLEDMIKSDFDFRKSI